MNLWKWILVAKVKNMNVVQVLSLVRCRDNHVNIDFNSSFFSFLFFFGFNVCVFLFMMHVITLNMWDFFVWIERKEKKNSSLLWHNTFAYCSLTNTAKILWYFHIHSFFSCHVSLLFFAFAFYLIKHKAEKPSLILIGFLHTLHYCVFIFFKKF